MAGFVSADALYRGLGFRPAPLLVRSVQGVRRGPVVRPRSVSSMRTVVCKMPRRTSMHQQMLETVKERPATPRVPGAWVDEEEEE